MIGFSLVVMIAIALFGRDSQFLDAVKTLGYFWAVVNAGPEQ